MRTAIAYLGAFRQHILPPVVGENAVLNMLLMGATPNIFSSNTPTHIAPRPSNYIRSTIHIATCIDELLPIAGCYALYIDISILNADEAKC